MFGAVVRTVSIVVLLVLAGGAVAFAALGGEDGPEAPPVLSGPAAGQVEGVLIGVEEERLTLRPADGTPEQTFGLRPIDRSRIDLFHLLEHVREKWAVRVTWETEDGRRYAARVEDA
jgi:hypothetical protein